MSKLIVFVFVFLFFLVFKFFTAKHDEHIIHLTGFPMNKSAILPMLLALLPISIIIGFDLCWYHYITCTLKSYGVAEHDIVKRLDTFFFILGFEVFCAAFGAMTIPMYMSDGPSNKSAWPF